MINTAGQPQRPVSHSSGGPAVSMSGRAGGSVSGRAVLLPQPHVWRGWRAGWGYEHLAHIVLRVFGFLLCRGASSVVHATGKRAEPWIVAAASSGTGLSGLHGLHVPVTLLVKPATSSLPKGTSLHEKWEKDLWPFLIYYNALAAHLIKKYHNIRLFRNMWAFKYLKLFWISALFAYLRNGNTSLTG